MNNESKNKLNNKLAGKWLALALATLPGGAWADYEYPGGAVHLGYRVDSLDWNISGEGDPTTSEPNILSELEWRDLQIFELKGELSGASKNQIYFRGSASYGWVLDGENQDSDYAGDDRTLEFSRSINGVDGSWVMDFTGAVGPEISFGQREQHRFIPLIGYSFHSQRLHMTNGNQVLWNQANAESYDSDYSNYLPPPLGPFPGLHSHYKANWSSFWLGADLLLDLQDSGTLFASVEGHWGDYAASADWNLRPDFAHPVSFEHEADSRGWVVQLGWRQPPSRYRWTWGANLVLQRWTTDSGIDRTFVVDPSYSCYPICEGKLNEVNWQSASVAITLRKELSR